MTKDGDAYSKLDAIVSYKEKQKFEYIWQNGIKTDVNS